MLKSLSIKNFALIDDVQLTTDAGFTTMTGETGAGKSIILGALSLLLGKRADLDAIRDRSKKCIVEGVFEISDYNLQALFEENDLDFDEETIIRREILPSGKSRGFVNDTPIRVKQMQSLGKNLVDIHSQNEAAFLKEENRKFDIVDALAKNGKNLDKYRQSFRHWQQLKKQFQELEQKEKESASTHDYDKFLLEELQNADLKPGKQEELEEQLKALNNVEVLKENLGASAHQMGQEEMGILSQLREVNQKLSQISGYGKNYENLAERLNSILVEAEDISMELENQNEQVEDDPHQLESINTQVQEIYQLQQKHHTQEEAELIEIRQKLHNRVTTFENSGEELEKLRSAIISSEEKALADARTLHQKRKKALPDFTKSVEGILSELGMPEAEMKIELKESPELNIFGNDQMTWLLKANRGSRFQVLEKAASGGEQSRIILAIKNIMARFQQQPSIIFDEIDTGVSGEIAKKMGAVMRTMAKNRQVISITHLPQIAAQGQHHFKVFKENTAGVTTTKIQLLAKEQRIAELAGMLGGQEQSKSAMAHAESLINENQ